MRNRDTVLTIGEDMEFHFYTPHHKRQLTSVSALDMEVVQPVEVEAKVGEEITLTLRVVAVHRTER